jgi:DNA-binding protein YbaB
MDGHGQWDDAPEELAKARREIRDFLAARAEGGEREGRGEAADGMIRVVAVGGRLSQVEIDPRAMRMASQALAEEFTKAANTALSDLQAGYATGAPNVNLDALASQMEQFQQASERDIRRLNESITRAIAAYAR